MLISITIFMCDATRTTYKRMLPNLNFAVPPASPHSLLLL
jgi:hypothetical protein